MSVPYKMLFVNGDSMMENVTIEQQVQQYIDKVKKSIHEPIVDRHLGLFPVDEVKAFFILLPFINGERRDENVYQVAVAIGAIHAAFDAHDLVDTMDATSRHQQLLVLSGDHFSGIHYQILASLPDFSFIRSISATIGQVNEMKTLMSESSCKDVQTLIHQTTKIESGCIAKFYQAFGFTSYQSLMEITLTIRALQKRRMMKNQTFAMQPSQQRELIEAAISYLHEQLQEEQHNVQFLHPALQKELTKMVPPLLGKPI